MHWYLAASMKAYARAQCLHVIIPSCDGFLHSISCLFYHTNFRSLKYSSALLFSTLYMLLSIPISLALILNISLCHANISHLQSNGGNNASFCSALVKSYLNPFVLSILSSLQPLSCLGKLYFNPPPNYLLSTTVSRYYNSTYSTCSSSNAPLCFTTVTQFITSDVQNKLSMYVAQAYVAATSFQRLRSKCLQINSWESLSEYNLWSWLHEGNCYQTSIHYSHPTVHVIKSCIKTQHKWLEDTIVCIGINNNKCSW